MKIAIRIALLVCAMSAALLGGTVPTVATAGPGQACNLGFMPIKPTVGVGSIIGNAWADCNPAPRQRTFTLSLERYDAGSWWLLQQGTDTGIPNPRRVYEIKTKCTAGLWRISAHAVGSIGGTSFDFGDSSMERFICAADCARGN
ncbi:hypothetical protein ACLMAJ_19920 [Nocardia sp. KC 131]|uniref:hypothetical protein n=1 Tax=Nocardia arseniciresistens TaxID=3392119 RepID=UPI00398EE321